MFQCFQPKENVFTYRAAPNTFYARNFRLAKAKKIVRVDPSGLFVWQGGQRGMELFMDQPFFVAFIGRISHKQDEPLHSILPVKRVGGMIATSFPGVGSLRFLPLFKLLGQIIRHLNRCIGFTERIVRPKVDGCHTNILPFGFLFVENRKGRGRTPAPGVRF